MSPHHLIVPLLLCASASASPLSRGDASAPEIEVGGKFFARADASSQTAYARELSLASARLSVDARWKGFLKISLDADLTASPLVSDAFIDLKAAEGLTLRAGRFNSPFSARQLEGFWKYSLVDRGQLNDAITSAGYGGRRFGFEAKLSRKEWRGAQLELAVMHGLSPDKEDLAARLSAIPLAGLTVGLNAYAIAFGRTGVAAGADAEWLRGETRVTLEGLAGSLPGGAAAGTAESALVYTRRGRGLCTLVSQRLPIGESWFLEPLLAGELLKIDTGLPTLTETAGVNLGRSEALRLQLSGTRRHPAGQKAVETLLTAQLGAHF